jgi:hypothetical protein
MSEYAPFSHELSGSERGIQGLRGDFERYGDSYFVMFMTLRQYADAHLGIDLTDSIDLIFGLEEAGRLPTKRSYEADPVAALEMHRLAVYTVWMPLFQLSHSSDEFKTWLPHALHIIAPDTGRHTVGRCTIDGGYETPTSETCAMSDCCPVRHVICDITHLAVDAPMDTLDYVLDPDKTHSNTETLVTGVYEHKMIPAYKKSALLAVYQWRYERTFPDPGATE